jgi:hypothetical protein
MSDQMDKYEKNNLMETFGGVIEAAFNEKLQEPSWKAKIDKADVKANLALQMNKDSYFMVHLIIDHGKMKFEEGELENYDLELRADPEDLIFFVNATYSTLDMVLKKNEWGFPKLRVKKGFRNVGKLLFVSGLLVLKPLKK